jgi:hypothetical protein
MAEEDSNEVSHESSRRGTGLEFASHCLHDLLVRGESERQLLQHRLAVHDEVEAGFGCPRHQFRVDVQRGLQGSRRTGSMRLEASGDAVGDDDLRVSHGIVSFVLRAQRPLT